MYHKLSRGKGGLIFFIWIINIVLLFVPDGLLNRRINAFRSQLELEEIAKSQSPYNEICHFCNNPATHFQVYRKSGRDITLYFCSQHETPQTVSSRSGHFGLTLFDIMVIGFIALFYGLHSFDSIKHLFFGQKEPSIILPIIGLILACSSLFWDKIANFF